GVSGTTDFFRYSISGNSWTSLASTPLTAVSGSLVYPGSGDFIYAARGSSTSTFYRYSISGNSWTSMTSAPGVISMGSLNYPNTGDFIYALGGGGLATFYRYSISGNSWTTLTAAPQIINYGALLYPGSGDFIYALRGTIGNGFYRYSISGNSWISGMAGADTAQIGGGAVYAGGFAYALQGNGLATGFYRFSFVSYPSSGTFESSSMDLAAAISFSTLAFTSTLPSGVQSSCTANTGAGCALKLQIAANNDNATWNYVGPNNTGSTYFTATGETIPGALTNLRYFRYKLYLATENAGLTPLLDSLTTNYVRYPSSQTLTSSPYNSTSPGNLVSKLNWSDSGTTGTETVQFQIRSAATSGSLSSAPWCGYEDCSGSTFFDVVEKNVALDPAHPLLNGGDDQYIQYRLILSSGGLAAATLSDVTVQYVVNAAPNFDTSFGVNGITVNQISNSADPNWGKVKIDYRVRDVDSSQGSVTNGLITPSFQYDAGSGLTTINPSNLSPSATANKAVDDVNYTTYTAYWDAAADLPGTYVPSLSVKVIVDDNEPANHIANATDNITFDSKDPVLGGTPIIVDASTTPATLTLSATDDSSFQMRIGLLPDTTDGSYVAYNSSAIKALATNPDTVYVQFRDIYGNESAVVSASSTETPSLVMIQDISNISTSEYRLFISWRAVDEPVNGFANYKLYRSTDNVSYSVIATTVSRSVNFYIDDSVV